MKLYIDFEKNEVTYELESQKGTIIVDNLQEKEEQILDIIGLKKEPMEDLKNDINNLFKELGLNDITCQ